MLRTDFVELINSGAAWAFVGSGPSIASGYPKWGQLVSDTVAALDSDIQTLVQGDYSYVEALTKGNYPECFARIEHLAGRKLLAENIRRQLRVSRPPGRITSLLADWPFAGYVTTNYDTLLEQALQKHEQLGWLSIGNTRQECRKLAGEPKGLVWHIHGSVALPEDRSELILTNRDYDGQYLENSAMELQLRSLLLQRRVVFFGFGFQDPDVVRLLRLVGRYGNPPSPAYALLAGVSGMEFREQRRQLLEKYNVDVIPYRVDNGSHENLRETLETYGALILKRTQRFGQPARPCPSYDPETTGLLVYNTLSLRGEMHVAGDVKGSLLRPRILSLLKWTGPMDIEAIKNDLREKALRLNAQPSGNGDNDEVKQALDELVQRGHVQTVSGTESQVVVLTPAGEDMVAEQAAIAERFSEQFSASLGSRARQYTRDDATVGRVADAAESFLKNCVQKRALGVAMVWNSADVDYRSLLSLGRPSAGPP